MKFLTAITPWRDRTLRARGERNAGIQQGVRLLMVCLLDRMLVCFLSFPKQASFSASHYMHLCCSNG